MKTFDFFFDYSSPFAYLAATQVEALAQRTNAQVRYRPFLLGALFRELGTPLVPIASFPAAKQKYLMQDIARFAKRYQVPFRFPSGFPLRTVDALRATLALEDEARAPFVAQLMHLIWAEDFAPTKENIAAVFEETQGSVFPLDRFSETSLKDALRAETDAARAAGLPGAPGFVVEGEIFWGQDRMDFVEEALLSSKRGD